ncbi:DUF881 domain-containing protein [Nocardioides jishulii]|nr:DUF881 domain-containing protein [Nocardioides jishulii]
MSSTPDPTAPDEKQPDQVEPERAVDESPADAEAPSAAPDDVAADDATLDEIAQDEPTPDEGTQDETPASDSADQAPSEAESSQTDLVEQPSSELDASASEAAPADRTVVRARLRQMFVKPGRSQAVVGVLLALLGFAAVAQVRNTQLDDTYEGRREEELIEIFNGVAGTSDRTRREIARLEQDRRELLVDTSAREAAVEQAETRLRTLNMLAGLVPVTGPGLRVTITEEAGRITIDSLLDTIQELRTAGAEAIEFDGRVRLVASSSFSEVDGVIHLDGEPLRSPYVIEVIGEPHTLHTGLTFPSGPVATLRGDQNADVAIEELDSVDIESVRSLPRAEFASPAEGQ